MLVLGRKSGESIRVGDEIVITIVQIGHDCVRIGIEAPTRVTVHREEVYDRVASANRQAASELPGDVLDRLNAAVARDASGRDKSGERTYGARGAR